MEIPKLPLVPQLNAEDIIHITQIVFGTIKKIEYFDSMLLFGGSHPCLWETAIEMYRENPCNYIFLTGGNKKTAVKHETWTHHQKNESDIIEEKLIDSGISSEIIIKENRSTNSYENVFYIQEEINKRRINNLLCISKSYGVGRQYRTIKKRFPELNIQMKGFDTSIDFEGNITRLNWTEKEKWKSLIWGEYLRNYVYSVKGDILMDFVPTENIQKKLKHIYIKRRA